MKTLFPLFNSRNRIINTAAKAAPVIEKSLNRDYLSTNTAKTMLLDFLEKRGLHNSVKIGECIGESYFTKIFDIGKNKVIRISRENPFEYRNYNKSFDIPVFSTLENYKDCYILICAKADTQNIQQYHVLSVIKRMKKQGFEPSLDFRKHRNEQVGLYQNTPYLLDFRCAIKKPNAFSRFVYDMNRRYKRIIQVQKPCTDNRLVHVDETPRRNIGFSEGLKILIQVIKENLSS